MIRDIRSNQQPRFISDSTIAYIHSFFIGLSGCSTG